MLRSVLRRKLTRGCFAATAAIVLAAISSAWAQEEPTPPPSPAPPPLVIVDETLPSLNAGIDVRVPLHARGGVPPYHWTLSSGELPAGIALEPDGFLAGRPSRPGTFALTLAVTDSAQPANTISKDFKAEVTASLLLDWLRLPQVHGGAIDGAVQVSNGSKDDFDLTVIIVAVNEIGRATALGYQHITLTAGTTNFEVTFGSTLPRGAYVVHADAIAEIPAKNTILRQRLQTPNALQVTQGP